MRVLAAVQMKRQNDLKAFLGPVGYARWERYEPTLEVRRRASELSEVLRSSGDGVTAKQQQLLLKTLLAQQQRSVQNAQLDRQDGAH